MSVTNRPPLWRNDSGTGDPSAPTVGGTLLVIAACVSSSVLLGWRVLRSGYGADNDTWLILGTWDVIVEQGRYVPSRFQGYPLPELLIGASSDLGGHWLAGGLSAVFGLAAAVLVHQLAAQRGATRQDALLVTAILVVTPSFVLASTTSIDYVYGLTFFLGGWLATERRASPTVAGLLLALAAASRITYLPIGLLLLALHPAWRTRDRAARRDGILVMIAVTALAYVPSAVFHGMNLPGAWADRPTGQGLFGLVGRAVFKGADLLGVVGTGLVVAVVVAAVISRRGRGQPAFERWMSLSLVVQVAAWFWLPVEPSYLLPAWVMILVALAPSLATLHMRRLAVALLLVVSAAGWVSIRVLDYQYESEYGVDSCDPTLSTGASPTLDIDRGQLLAHPDEVRDLRACNEAQRESQRSRVSPADGTVGRP